LTGKVAGCRRDKLGREHGHHNCQLVLAMLGGASAEAGRCTAEAAEGGRSPAPLSTPVLYRLTGRSSASDILEHLIFV